MQMCAKNVVQAMGEIATIEPWTFALKPTQPICFHIKKM